MTEIGKAIVNALDNHSGWVQGSCTINNTELGLSIWTANVPILDLRVHHPEGISLSLHDKWFIFFAIDRRNAKNLLEKLGLKDKSMKKVVGIKDNK